MTRSCFHPRILDDFRRDLIIVTVVIVDYNGWKDTRQCVRALTRQTFSEFEITLVCNGDHPDDSLEDGTFSPPFSLILNPENLGFARAANQGISRAAANKSRYVWLLNNDTIPSPDALKELIAEAERQPRAGAIASVLLDAESRTIQVWGGGKVARLIGLPTHFKRRQEPEYLCGASLLIRTEALLEVGMFDERYFLYWEDTDLSFRLRSHGWTLSVAGNSQVLHKGSSSAGFQTPFYDYWFTRSSIRFFRDHFNVWLIPLAISVSGRFLRRLITGRWNCSLSVLKGTSDGLRETGHAD